MSSLVNTAAMFSAALAFAAHSAAAESLRIAADGQWFPYSYLSPQGDLVGMEPDMASEMCKRLNVECEQTAMPFDGIIAALQAGKFDLAATGFAYSEERAATVLFTEPFYGSPKAFVVKADEPFALTDEFMEGKVIAAQKGTLFIDPLRREFSDVAQVREYDNAAQMMADMNAGRIDVSVGEAEQWTTEFIEKSAGEGYKLVPIDFAFFGSGNIELMHWVVRQDKPELVTQMNEVLSTMLSDCTITTIRKRYLKVPMSSEPEACLAQ